MNIDNESEVIKKLITTPYEKVIKKLNNIKTFLLSLSKTMTNDTLNKSVKDIEWVISQIKSQNLYSYSNNIDNDVIKLSKDANSKLKHMLDYITMNTELSHDTFQRSGAYMKIRKEINIVKKKNSLKANEAQMKQIKKIRNEYFISNNLPKHRSRSSGSGTNENNDTNKTKKKSCIKKSQTENIDNTKKEINKPNHIQISPHSKGLKNNTPIRRAHTKSMKVLNALSANILDINSATLSSTSFNIFDFKSSHGYINVLPLIGGFLFSTFSLTSQIIQCKLNTFLFTLSKGYHESTIYHNAIHGADVAQTLGTFFLHSSLSSSLRLSSQDLVAIFTAALAHDLGHPGTNNAFQINVLTDLAITYNDVSVLENFHCTSLFKALQEDKCNIFSDYNNLDVRKTRKRIINMILATDMFNHGKVLGKTRSKMKSSNDSDIVIDDTNLFDDQQEYLDCLIHIADISHNAKSFEITSKWVSLLNEEMMIQGDKERESGISVSYMCDRSKVDIPKSQIGFINAFIIPSFELLCVMTKEKLKGYLDNAKSNLKVWEKKNEENKNNNKV